MYLVPSKAGLLPVTYVLVFIVFLSKFVAWRPGCRRLVKSAEVFLQNGWHATPSRDKAGMNVHFRSGSKGYTSCSFWLSS